MRRRTFLGLAGAAVAFPRVALGQQAKLPRVALASSAVAPSGMVIGGDGNWSALLQQLAKDGFVEGQTVTFERYLTPQGPGVGKLVADIIATSPDLIFWGGASDAAHAAVAMNKTIPMLAWVGDFLGTGLVDNIARPGGNISGLSSNPSLDVEGKMLQFLFGVAPNTKSVAYIVDGTDGNIAAGEQAAAASTSAAATRLGISLVPVLIRSGDTTDQNFIDAFAFIARNRADAVLFSLSPTARIGVPVEAKLAFQARLPSIAQWPPYAQGGGLISYGPDQLAQSRDVADYVALVLRGAHPGDLPVLEPDAFQLILNLTTAKAIGVTIPASVLVQATEVIQ